MKNLKLEKDNKHVNILKPIFMTELAVSPQESMYVTKTTQILLILFEFYLRSGTDRIPQAEYHWMPVEKTPHPDYYLEQPVAVCLALLSITPREPY